MNHEDKSSSDLGKAYQGIKTRLFLFGLILDVTILVVFFSSGLSLHLKNFSSQLSSNFFILNGIYIFLFMTAISLIHFPLRFYQGFIVEHQFKLSRQRFHQWFEDECKKFFFGFLIVLILGEFVYACLRFFPDTWWIWAAGGWITFTFILAQFMPHVIIPLFYKYVPLENKELKDRIFKLFESCRIPLKDIYVINFSAKTAKANAFLCGIGKSRRVVLSDTLLSNFSADEIEVVVAHELGHYKHGDILKMLFVNSAVIFSGLFLVNQFFRATIFTANAGEVHRLDDISFFPVICLTFIVFGFAAAPVMNWYSRIMEYRADRFCIEKTGRVDDFITLMQKLAERNLADVVPSRWEEIFFYDHPPISKRMASARNSLNHPGSRR